MLSPIRPITSCWADHPSLRRVLRDRPKSGAWHTAGLPTFSRAVLTLLESRHTVAGVSELAWPRVRTLGLRGRLLAASARIWAEAGRVDRASCGAPSLEAAIPAQNVLSLRC